MPDDTVIPLPRQIRGVSAGTFLHPNNNPTPDVRSLYIHVPFCAHKCHYCDFYSIVDRQGRQDAFADRLARELVAMAPLAGPLETIFIGGGTPTLLRPDLLEQVFDTIHDHYDCSRLAECTVECNPETASEEVFAVLRAGGVNRLSLGAQTFNPTHLRTLERTHNPDNVARAIELARAIGIDRLSVDLIFAIPRQTLPEWEADLARALDLGTTHLSCYALIYEPGTALTARRERGEFDAILPDNDDLETDMYLRTIEVLRERGLERYEVSNFAREDEACAHNLAYWRQHDWLAAGPSASGHVAGHRWKNVPRLDDYLRLDDEGFTLAVDHEPPDAARALAELLMTGVRLREGIDLGAITLRAEALGPAVTDRVLRTLDRAHESGLLTLEAGWYRPTDSGFLVADRLASDLIAAVG